MELSGPDAANAREEGVQAAGGVVTRIGREGVAEVLLVHRPRYDDWTFPKGKLLAGETYEAAAVREVCEETGLSCHLGRSVGSTCYVDRRGQPKVVHYWKMTVLDGTFTRCEEVDEARWVPPDAAGGLLTYARDRQLLEELPGPVDADPVLLLRHARAGKRTQWKGDDRQRPLDERGQAQAEELVDRLRSIPLTRILTSPYLRCVQTVIPIGSRLGLPLELRHELAEGVPQREVLALFDEVAGGVVLACTHGDIVWGVVGEDRPAKKASAWVLEPEEGQWRPTVYLQPDPDSR